MKLNTFPYLDSTLFNQKLRLSKIFLYKSNLAIYGCNLKRHIFQKYRNFLFYFMYIIITLITFTCIYIAVLCNLFELLFHFMNCYILKGVRKAINKKIHFRLSNTDLKLIDLIMTMWKINGHVEPDQD